MDDDFFQQRFQNVQESLLRRARRVTGCDADALDLVQEVAIAVLINLREGKVEHPEKFEHYAHGVLSILIKQHKKTCPQQRHIGLQLSPDTIEVYPSAKVDPESALRYSDPMSAGAAQLDLHRDKPTIRKLVLASVRNTGERDAMAKAMGVSDEYLTVLFGRANKLFVEDSIDPFADGGLLYEEVRPSLDIDLPWIWQLRNVSLS
jgi:DNA-directed RNA polymerase specialized sigma24 family protein